MCPAKVREEDEGHFPLLRCALGEPRQACSPRTLKTNKSMHVDVRSLSQRCVAPSPGQLRTGFGITTPVVVCLSDTGIFHTTCRWPIDMQKNLKTMGRCCVP